MTNINSPYGFIPIVPNARVSAYTVASGYATQLNLGDPVALNGTGTGPYAQVAIAVSGSPLVGVFAGCQYIDVNGQPVIGSKIWPASNTATSIIAYVYDDPNTQFRAQLDGAWAVTGFGNDTSFTVGAGSLGVSGYVLSSSNIGTGTDFQLVQQFNDPLNNTVGTFASIQGYFRLHQLAYPHTPI